MKSSTFTVCGCGIDVYLEAMGGACRPGIGDSIVNRSIHVVVRGRVQGVSYRYWTHAEANRRGLSGWVRNRDDGAVEAVFAGPDGQVQEMLLALRSGPPAARVSDVEIIAEGGVDAGESFRIRY
jgi:acylphosphatase